MISLKAVVTITVGSFVTYVTNRQSTGSATATRRRSRAAQPGSKDIGQNTQDHAHISAPTRFPRMTKYTPPRLRFCCTPIDWWRKRNWSNALRIASASFSRFSEFSHRFYIFCIRLESSIKSAPRPKREIDQSRRTPGVLMGRRLGPFALVLPVFARLGHAPVVRWCP